MSSSDDRLRTAVLLLWKAKRDTVEIAKTLNLKENVVADILFEERERRRAKADDPVSDKR
jgi:hypothetical protein